jgi:hypothetical protein
VFVRFLVVGGLGRVRWRCFGCGRCPRRRDAAVSGTVNTPVPAGVLGLVVVEREVRSGGCGGRPDRVEHCGEVVLPGPAGGHTECPLAARHAIRAFVPVLRNAVTTEYLHVEALRDAGGKPLTTRYWFPDATFGAGGIGLFETLEVVETIEISLYLIGVSAFAQRGEDFGARLCAEAMGTEAVHRALVRFAQGELGNEQIGPPNDVGFENYDWPTVAGLRAALEELGIGYGAQTAQPGRFYDYPGDPLATGIGTPVSHTKPA